MAMMIMMGNTIGSHNLCSTYGSSISATEKQLHCITSRNSSGFPRDVPGIEVETGSYRIPSMATICPPPQRSSDLLKRDGSSKEKNAKKKKPVVSYTSSFLQKVFP